LLVLSEQEKEEERAIARRILFRRVCGRRARQMTVVLSETINPQDAFDVRGKRGRKKAGV